jgi:hypothetical protein
MVKPPMRRKRVPPPRTAMPIQSRRGKRAPMLTSR